MFGETTKTLNDVNQWALKWDSRPPEDHDNVEEGCDTKGQTEDEKEKGKVKRFELIVILLIF